MTKEYYETHKEERAEYYKKWREDNAEYIKQKKREYYLKNKEKIKEKTKKWKEENPEKSRVHEKTYREKTSDYQKERSKNYFSTKHGRAGHLIQSYKRRDNECNRGKCTLTRDWIIDHIFNCSCVYCGDSDWTHLGADRIDNSLPHTPENCVCACGVCNIERQIKKMSVEEFKDFRKTHPRGWDKIENIKSEIVEVSGVKVLRKKVG